MSRDTPRPTFSGRPRLGRRLTRAAMGAAGAALLAAAVLSNVFAVITMRERLVENTAVQARVAADNVAPALLFGEVRAATDLLLALENLPALQAAILTDLHGETVTAYRRPGVDGPPAVTLPTDARDSGHAFADGRLHLWVSVQHEGRLLGRLQLAVTLRPLYERSAVVVGLTLVVFMVALLIAYLLVRRVARDVDGVEARLDELAFHDPVTGLLNRHAANEHLHAMVHRALARGEAFGLMLLDLDDFKLVNDTLGHAAGDEVLRLLARRLAGGVRAQDKVFRLGGDEFVVIVEGPLHDGAASRLGNAVMQALQHPLQLPSRQQLHLRGSAGIATFPADAQDGPSLLRAADTAMYEAKAQGKNTFAIFDAAMADRVQTRVRLDAELRQALQRGELVLYYQPIVDIRDGRIRGAEALLRWQHPQRGLVMPMDFIQAAEDSGLVVDIGAWVLERAAAQLAQWAGDGLGHLSLAVNVSGQQVGRGLLQAQVEAALQRHPIDARRLELEITEHTLVENIETNIAALATLRERGMRLAIDDFGTGLSSLSYLKRLPLDKFKIDRSFVCELPDAQGDVAIVSAIVSMARALGLSVVAEGVETEAQRALLKALGCDFAQGWLFSPALPADRFVQWVHAHGVAAPTHTR